MSLNHIVINDLKNFYFELHKKDKKKKIFGRLTSMFLHPNKSSTILIFSFSTAIFNGVLFNSNINFINKKSIFKFYLNSRIGIILKYCIGMQ